MALGLLDGSGVAVTLRPWSQIACARVLAWLLISKGILAKLLKRSLPLFPHRQDGGHSTSTCVRGCVLVAHKVGLSSSRGCAP